MNTGHRMGSRALVSFLVLAAGACAYDFDGLVAIPGATAGTSGSGGSAGAGGNGGADDGGPDEGGAGAGKSGAAGTSGSGGSSGKGGAAGSSGKGGAADASTDRASDARVDSAPFDCTAVSGMVFQGHCYYASTVTGNWDSANTNGCAAPSHLVTITSMGEQNTVAAILNGQERWIGMRRAAGSPDMESSFRWITNEGLNFRSWEVYEAGAPEPNFTGDCVRLRTTGNWADAPCNESRAAICERE